MEIDKLFKSYTVDEVEFMFQMSTLFKNFDDTKQPYLIHARLFYLVLFFRCMSSDNTFGYSFYLDLFEAFIEHEAFKIPDSKIFNLAFKDSEQLLSIIKKHRHQSEFTSKVFQRSIDELKRRMETQTINEILKEITWQEREPSKNSILIC